MRLKPKFRDLKFAAIVPLLLLSSHAQRIEIGYSEMLNFQESFVKLAVTFSRHLHVFVDAEVVKKKSRCPCHFFASTFFRGECHIYTFRHVHLLDVITESKSSRRQTLFFLQGFFVVITTSGELHLTSLSMRILDTLSLVLLLLILLMLLLLLLLLCRLLRKAHELFHLCAQR